MLYMLHVHLILILFLGNHLISCAEPRFDGARSADSGVTLDYPPVRAVSWHPKYFGPYKRASISFTAYDRKFTLKLHSNEGLFSKGTQIDRNARVSTKNVMSGLLLGEPGSRVNGYLKGGVFYGSIYSSKDNVSYSIEQIRHVDGRTTPHSVISKNVAGEVEFSGRFYVPPVPRKSNVVNSSRILNMFRPSPKRTISNRICTVFIEVDVSYSNFYGDHAYGVYQAMSRVAEASSIMQNLPLMASSTSAEGYKLRIGKVRANRSTDPNPSIFTASVLDINVVLATFARNDFSRYCLAMIFLSKSFKGEVAGAAYLANPDDDNGGICSGRRYHIINGRVEFLNLNVMAHTNLILNRPMKTFQETGNILHEIGHAYGANHDPPSSVCTPDVAHGGPYLMYPVIKNKLLPNALKFSLCSRIDIENILKVRANMCFTETENLCGNSILDPGEECDCGDFDSFCYDSCCSLPSSDTPCKLKAGYTCSPKQGSCCSAQTCQMKIAGEECTSPSYCSFGSYCNGSSAICPRPVSKNELEVCNAYGAVCSDGDCTGSPCKVLNMQQCSCKIDNSIDDQCKLCCEDKFTGKCIYAAHLKKLTSTYVSPGTACSDETVYGQCDNSGNCFVSGFSESEKHQKGIKIFKYVLHRYWVVMLLAVFAGSILIFGR